MFDTFRPTVARTFLAEDYLLSINSANNMTQKKAAEAYKKFGVLFDPQRKWTTINKQMTNQATKQ